MSTVAATSFSTASGTSPEFLRELGYSEDVVRAFLEALQRGLSREDAMKIVTREEAARRKGPPDPGSARVVDSESTRKP